MTVDFDKLDRWEIAHLYVTSCMKMYHQTLSRVTITRSRNKKGRALTGVCCYLLDTRNNTHSLFFRLFDDEYIWFLNRLSREYPDVDVMDLSQESETAKEVV